MASISSKNQNLPIYSAGSGISDAASNMSAAVSGAAAGISNAASAASGAVAGISDAAGAASGAASGIADAAGAASGIADMAKNLPLPPNIKMALDTVEMISSMMKPAKQVPEPKDADLKKGITKEVLNKNILDKQFEDELYKEYKKKEEDKEKEWDEEIKTNFDCKQYGGDDDHPEYIKTRLKENIHEKVICKHVKELIVKNFEEFIDKRVVHPHFHSKDKKTNNLDTLSIFYRHGLSKIISKMVDDLKKNKDILDFFLDEIVKLVIDMEDKKMIEFFDNIDNNFIFDVMNSDKVVEFNNKNRNHEAKMKKLLVKLYPESEFNQLMLEIEKENDNKNPDPDAKNPMSKMEITKWKEIYNGVLDKENKRENQKHEEESLLLEKIGIDKVLELFKLNKTPKPISKMHFKYINKKTNFDDIDDETEKKGGVLDAKKEKIQNKRKTQKIKHKITTI